jgi:hypothetical protein
MLFSLSTRTFTPPPPPMPGWPSSMSLSQSFFSMCSWLSLPVSLHADGSGGRGRLMPISTKGYEHGILLLYSTVPWPASRTAATCVGGNRSKTKESFILRYSLECCGSPPSRNNPGIKWIPSNEGERTNRNSQCPMPRNQVFLAARGFHESHPLSHA